MKSFDLIERTKKFTVSIITFSEKLPDTKTCNIISNQLIRCGTSVGANYRAACRGKSKADFVAKMGIVEEEADEVIYWLDILKELKIGNIEEIAILNKEADEIVAITVSSIKTAKNIVN